ncbi:Probable nicotinate-nucleotide pyrophosphorylase [carboxylating] [Geodia barretti]|uniref:Nicotinate-nucleotide pyrophosphorylase [carboxylating] n=1 Tax=Geodia barretti TaxID=519541 RepID=A0AA35U3N2_GEOBA|nr:Probable nicotinate-nucleotide pyrophosphorylase [carboxylating] [Geodia barretti]
MTQQLPPEVLNLIDSALTEDQAFNDPTTQTLIPGHVVGSGVLRAKAIGVLAGGQVAAAVFHRIDPQLDIEFLLDDGAALDPGQDIATVYGPAASILRAERTALNFIQRMSGIATATNHYVNAVVGTNARIVDTRKTAPGHRYLDKYSVRMGGGYNHRLNLADGILIKDNHLAARASLEEPLGDVVRRAISLASHTIRVEVEVESLEQVHEAVAAGAHIIMLDNMPVTMMQEAVGIIAGRASIEASGGITLETVREVAETGVDLISIGGLTHSPDALDISLDLEFPQ